MIKLTSLYYKIKTKSLENYHNLNEHNAGRIFEWEQEYGKAENLGGEYPVKPFIEPFEFTNDDYDIKEKQLKVRLEDIFSYGENQDGVVEVKFSNGDSLTVKETIEEIDKLFEENLDND